MATVVAVEGRAIALLVTATFGCVLAVATLSWHGSVTSAVMYGAGSAVTAILFVAMVLISELKSGR